MCLKLKEAGGQLLFFLYGGVVTAVDGGWRGSDGEQQLRMRCSFGITLSGKGFELRDWDGLPRRRGDPQY